MLSRDLTSQLNVAISFLVECRPLCASMANAIKFIKLQARRRRCALSRKRDVHVSGDTHAHTHGTLMRAHTRHARRAHAHAHAHARTRAQVSRIDPGMPQEDAKALLLERIAGYMQEKIVYAGKARACARVRRARACAGEGGVYVGKKARACT